MKILKRERESRKRTYDFKMGSKRAKKMKTIIAMFLNKVKNNIRLINHKNYRVLMFFKSKFSDTRDNAYGEKKMKKKKTD